MLRSAPSPFDMFTKIMNKKKRFPGIMPVGRGEIFTFPLTDAEAFQSRGAVNKTGLCYIITDVRLRSVSQREASLL